MRASTPSSRIAAGASRKTICDFITIPRIPQRSAASPSSLPHSSSRAERTEGEVVLTDLAEPQPSGPDGRLQVGHLEVDHVVASRLQSPAQRGQRIEVARRGETQDAYSTVHDDSSLLDCSMESDAHDGFRMPSRSVRS